MALMRETVWELLQEMDPSLAVKFLEKLDEKMKNTDYVMRKTPKLKEIEEEVKVISANIEDIND